MNIITTCLLSDLKAEKITQCKALLIRCDKQRARILNSSLSDSDKQSLLTKLRKSELSIETSLLGFKAMQLQDVAFNILNMLTTDKRE